MIPNELAEAIHCISCTEIAENYLKVIEANEDDGKGIYDFRILKCYS